MVKLRQYLDRIRHRLLYIPIAFVAASIVLAQAILYIDDTLADGDLPRQLETTVGSGRAILSTIAGGLISSITLLLSLMLVAVQLAGSQFSPRTLRDWIGDRTQQVTIGIVLGTTVYCLLILRETRSFGEGEALTPHLSVILAMVLGIASLIAVVRSVDHLTDSLRIGSVAGRIMAETIDIIENQVPLGASESPLAAPAVPVKQTRVPEPPDRALAVLSPKAGWVQQIDEDAILEAAPEGTTAYIMVSLGSFTLPDAPMVWLDPAPAEDDNCIAQIRDSVALGDGRTMQQDIGFGILQMVDIALRALSPGVNDPNTANDMIVHLGVIVLRLWERPIAATTRQRDNRTIVRNDLDHADYLHAAFDQIRRYGAGDAEVAATILRTLQNVHREVERRDLAGPLEPLQEAIDETTAALMASDLSDMDKARVSSLAALS